MAQYYRGIPVAPDDQQPAERKYYVGMTTSSLNYRACRWTGVHQDVTKAMNYFGLDDRVPIRIEPYFYFEYEMERRGAYIDNEVLAHFGSLFNQLFEFSLKSKGDKLIIATYYEPKSIELERMFSSLGDIRKMERLEGYLPEDIKKNK
jgi:hypothetical protein